MEAGGAATKDATRLPAATALPVKLAARVETLRA